MESGTIIIALCFLAVGVWLGWKQFTNGTGFIGSRLSPNTLEKINSGTVGAVIGKLVLSLVLGYFIFAFWLIALIFKIAFRITKGSF